MRPLFLFLAAAVLAAGQTPKPNAQGVAFGHIYLVAKDVPAMQEFWAKTMGAAPVQQGGQTGYAIHGMHVWIREGQPEGGTDGSAIRDIGLRVRELDELLTRAAAAGYQNRRTGRDSARLLAPENIIIELVEDKSLMRAVEADHLHIIVTNAGQASDWYTQRFGNPVPGVRLLFVTADRPATPTKARSLERIGFDVQDPDGFVKKHATGGTTFADPWGTAIEVRRPAS